MKMQMQPSMYPVTPLIGRESHVLNIMQLLSERRLVTLTGPGGIGKTRLAIHIAQGMEQRCANGVCFVTLASIQAAEFVLPAIAQALGLQEQAEHTLLAQLSATLRQQRMLLVLDNFEQVLPAAADVVTLLQQTNQLRILVTSRTVLNVAAEQQYAIPPLNLPASSTDQTLEVYATAAAVQLFVARARTTLPTFYLDEQNAPIIGQICRKLDGMPLAIELAAARSKVLPPEALLKWLDQRFQLLVARQATVDPRHQSLLNALSWSYNLLNNQEQYVFRLTSVFVGGFTLEAANAICSDLAPLQIIELLAALVDHSLLEQHATGDAPRFRYLLSIREYAWEQLASATEHNAVQYTYAEYFINFAQQASTQLRGPQQQLWLERLRAEIDNFHAILDWAKAHDHYAELLQLTAALWRFWWRMGLIREGRTWLETALALAANGVRYDPADPASLNLHTTWIRASNAAGNLAHIQGDLAAAKNYYQQSFTLCQQIDDLRGTAASLSHLAIIATQEDDVVTARKLHEESLALAQQLNHHQMIATGLNNLAILYEQERAYDQAHRLYTESAEYYEAAGNPWGKALILNNLGILAQRQHDHSTSRQLLIQSLEAMRALSDTQGMILVLEALASAIVGSQQHYASICLFGLTTKLHQHAGSSTSIDDQDFFTAQRDHARAHLTPQLFEQAWTQGQTLDLGPTVDQVLADPSLQWLAPLAQPHAALTERERQVLALLATGLTNKEIAYQLALSIHTVGDYTRSIFKKLGVASRNAATRYVVDHGLTETLTRREHP